MRKEVINGKIAMPKHEEHFVERLIDKEDMIWFSFRILESDC